MFERFRAERGDKLMHIAIDMGTADLLPTAQAVGDGLERIGIIGDNDFCADFFGDFANPLQDPHTPFALAQLDVNGFAAENGAGDRHDLILAVEFDMRKVKAQRFNLARARLAPFFP